MALAPLIRRAVFQQNYSIRPVPLSRLVISENDDLQYKLDSFWGSVFKRWRRTPQRSPEDGRQPYPVSAIDPITDKLELAEMEDSDPRHFTPIKALPTQDYICSFQDPLIEKIIGVMMNKRSERRQDRRAMTRELVYSTIELIKMTQLTKYHSAKTQEERDTIETNPYKIIHQAVENCKPLLSLEEVRKGGVIYRVPSPVTEINQLWRVLRWLIDTARYDKSTPDQKVYERLAYELLNAYNNTGKVVRQKQELHKEAETNKAYAHFRWGRKK